MGDVIDLAARRREMQRDAKEDVADEAALRAELRSWAESRGVSLELVIGSRLFREQRDQGGAGELVHLDNLPQDLDDALRECARSRCLTLDEYLEILLSDLRFAKEPPIL